ncbi:hypothetical protein [Latilactobacillus sakei]|uniref:hypothetical protein n=1 Tax=Latilactobacillus sakei TaxID=1599 RepID=UPI003F529E50
MLKVSDAFNSAFAAPDRELRARVTIGKTVYDSDDLTSINYDSGAMTGEQFSIGSTYMNSAKIIFSHLVEGLKQLDEVLVEFGVLKPDGTVEYVKMGTFIVDDKIQMDRNNNTTTIECMDRMTMLGGTYVSKLTYPARIKDVAIEIANMAGVKANETSFARLSENKINQPTGYTYRDAIGLIAQFQMGFALFDRDGLLDIRTLQDNSFKIDPNQYFLKGLVKNETFFKLNGISCTVVTTSKDENGNETSKTTVLQSGSSSGAQIKLANNVMTQDVLDRMYEALKFTNYYPFSLNWNGNPAVEAGDWLTVEDLQGNEFKVPNMSYTLTYNGGLTTTSKADTSVSSPATYSYGGSMSNIVNEIGGREGAEGNHIYEGTEDQKPLFPKEGDLWYKHVGPDTEEWIYKDGKWEFLTSTKPATDAQKAADAAQKEAEEAKRQANKAVDGANDAVAKAGFANDTATQAKSDAATALQKAIDAYAHGDQIKNGLTVDIDAVKGQVALKASQIDIDNLGGRVTSAEAQIKLQADQIALSVSKTELTNVLGSYATQTWTQGQIKTTADQINLSVSSVSNKLDNMKVGTLNLLKHSNPNVRDNTHYPMPPGDISVVLEEGETYTLTSRAMTERNGTNTNILQIMVQHPSSWDWEFDLVMDNSTMETRSRTFKVPKMPDGNYNFTVSAYVYPHINGGNYGVVDWFTLTRGTVPATTWTPSYEELVSDVQYAQLEVKVNGIQGTVENKADKSQITQLANQITSSITDAGQLNFVANSDMDQLDENSNIVLPDEITGWYNNAKANNATIYRSDGQWGGYNGSHGVSMLATNTAGTTVGDWTAFRQWIDPTYIGANDVWSFGAMAMVTGAPDISAFVELQFFDKNNNVIAAKQATVDNKKIQVWQRVKFEGMKTPEGAVKLLFGFVIHKYAWVTFSQPMLTKAETLGPYRPDGATYSQMTQLKDQINLRVEKDHIVNQINVSTEGILIAGQKVHITGQTSIDNAVIKDAMIANVKADKITAGTLNAANVNVINLNANNITTGTIKGANLSMNLNTGEVAFQHGRIHSTSNNIDINIDKGYISTADNNTRVMLKNGMLQFTAPGILDSDPNPYLRISNAGSGLNFYGAAFVGRDYAVLSNSANNMNLFDQPIGQSETFSGIATGISSSGWRPTKVGGAERGVIVSSGTPMSSAVTWVGSPPSIMVGYDSQGNMGGNRVHITGDYVHLHGVYERSNGMSPNVVINPDGALVRSTSASKYKTDIIRTNKPNYGDKLLELPTATWMDIAETKRFRNDPVNQVEPTRNFGMIAEDLADAGLEMLVVRGLDGELEGINYDRIGPALIPVIAKLKNEVETLKQKLEEKTA